MTANNNPKLSFVDRYLTLWILIAIAVGIGLGLIPDWSSWLGSLSSGTVSWPLAIGLILMMYPPLAKVRYSQAGKAFTNKKLLWLSMVINWIVGPILMTALGLLFLRDQPALLAGVVLVGLARCIAMVMVWNELANGNRNIAAGLVALNAVFQVLLYSVYIVVFLQVLLGLSVPGSSGGPAWGISALTVLTYLGIPFALGFLSRFIGERWKGRAAYETKFLPKIAPLTLIFLLFTVLIMFSLQGGKILSKPGIVLIVAIPYVLYFLIVWLGTLFLARALGGNYEDSVALAFSAGSNDFELAIAVAVALWGTSSSQALAAVVGPLIEVPVMVLLVKLALSLRSRLWKTTSNTSTKIFQIKG